MGPLRCTFTCLVIATRTQKSIKKFSPGAAESTPIQRRSVFMLVHPVEVLSPTINTPNDHTRRMAAVARIFTLSIPLISWTEELNLVMIILFIIVIIIVILLIAIIILLAILDAGPSHPVEHACKTFALRASLSRPSSDACKLLGPKKKKWWWW